MHNTQELERTVPGKNNILVRVLILLAIGIAIVLFFPTTWSGEERLEFTDKQLRPTSQISQLAADSDSIYLYYDGDSILEVYDHSGSYHYSIIIHSQPKGSGRITVSDGLLYIEDRSGNIYVLSGGEQLAFHSHAAAEYRAVFDEREYDFFLSSGKVYNRITNKVILNFSSQASRLTNAITLTVLIFCILVAIALGAVFLRKRNHKT